MKAIYINLDPYLAAFAAWLKAGKPGTVPSFQPLPLSVTIPLGETAAVYCPGTSDPDGAYFDVDGVEISALGSDGLDPTGNNIVAQDIAVNLSSYPAPSGSLTVYAVREVSGDTVAGSVVIANPSGAESITVPFTVLVRREQSSGPVDLVDFTPPAAAPSAADIKSALVEAGPSALAGVYIDGAKLSEGRGIECELHGGDSTTVYYYPVEDGTSITDIIGNVSSSN